MSEIEGKLGHSLGKKGGRLCQVNLEVRNGPLKNRARRFRTIKVSTITAPIPLNST